MDTKNNNLFHLLKRRGLLLILVAAILLETVGIIQYLFAKNGLREEADARAQSEMLVTQLKMDKFFHTVENNVQGIAYVLIDRFDSPDGFQEIIRLLMENNPEIVNGFVAFKENYYPEYGTWYEPVISRLPEGLVLHQVGSADHDYFATDWYRVPFETGNAFWSEPYFDKDGVQKLVITYSIPVQDKTGTRMGVLGVDIELDWLNEVVQLVMPYPNAHSTLVSREGQTLVAPADTLVTSKALRYETVIDRTGWRLSVVIPEESLYGKMKRVSSIVFLLQILGLILLVLIMQWTVRGQAKLEKVQNAHERVEHELLIARNIQMAMVPKIFPAFPGRKDLDMYAGLIPAKEVGGDLYDFFIRDEKLFFCIGDVSGKGVPASLVMAVTRSLFRTLAAHETSPAKVVSNMNDSIADENEFNIFVTFFCGVLDMKTGLLRYCNAGHNTPYTLTDVIAPLPVEPNIPLGVVGGFTYKEQEMQLAHDDAILLYTDGITEAENSALELFGEERMISVLRTRRTAEDQVNSVFKAVEGFVQDAPQSDDKTLLFLHYMGKGMA